MNKININEIKEIEEAIYKRLESAIANNKYVIVRSVVSCCENKFECYCQTCNTTQMVAVTSQYNNCDNCGTHQLFLHNNKMEYVSVKRNDYFHRAIKKIGAGYVIVCSRDYVDSDYEFHLTKNALSEQWNTLKTQPVKHDPYYETVLFREGKWYFITEDTIEEPNEEFDISAFKRTLCNKNTIDVDEESAKIYKEFLSEMKSTDQEEIQKAEMEVRLETAANYIGSDIDIKTVSNKVEHKILTKIIDNVGPHVMKHRCMDCNELFVTIDALKKDGSKLVCPHCGKVVVVKSNFHMTPYFKKDFIYVENTTWDNALLLRLFHYECDIDSGESLIEQKRLFCTKEGHIIMSNENGSWVKTDKWNSYFPWNFKSYVQSREEIEQIINKSCTTRNALQNSSLLRL